MTAPPTTDYRLARVNMVESQLRPNRVTDPAVLEAFLTVPREVFVSSEACARAYSDDDLPLGRGRYSMKPLLLARLLQAAEIRAEDRVLDLGCGTAYCSAVVGLLARIVTAVESDETLAGLAREALRAVDAANVSVIVGPLNLVYPARAPYDVILLGGAVGEVPSGVLAQLAEGGRLLGVVENQVGWDLAQVSGTKLLGEAVRITNRQGRLVRETLFDAGAHPLPGLDRARGFAFT
jgi:protein-L-isoaspartate(D-aspartate) O-methyltransferase